MQIHTTRFSLVEIDVADILLFPHGVIAFEDCRHWVLLGDEDNASLGWLQSITRGEVALAAVSPRRFAPEYQVHVTRGQLHSLDAKLRRGRPAHWAAALDQQRCLRAEALGDLLELFLRISHGYASS